MPMASQWGAFRLLPKTAPSYAYTYASSNTYAYAYGFLVGCSLASS